MKKKIPSAFKRTISSPLELELLYRAFRYYPHLIKIYGTVYSGCSDCYLEFTVNSLPYRCGFNGGLMEFHSCVYRNVAELALCNIIADDL